jgi:hypothetical protein
VNEHEIYHRLSRVSLDAASLRAQLDRQSPDPVVCQGLRRRLAGDLAALEAVLRPELEVEAEGEPEGSDEP